MMRAAGFVLLGALASWPGAGKAGPAGNWSIVNSPNSPPAPTENVASGTACITASDCWTVGWYSHAGTYQTLIQHWDGTTWSLVPSPNTGPTQANVLRSVSCVSTSDCWAVGSYSDGSHQRTLILRWDGSAWSIVASPSVGPDQYNYLLGVACTSASACVAVGYHSAASGFATLALRWDGATWSLSSSPNAASSPESLLNAVACASATECWAVGSYVDGVTGLRRTLIERWNGSAWAMASSPNALLTTDNDLRGVTCFSASLCWAVGSAFNGSAPQTLALRWNGASWSTVTSPSTGTALDNRLEGVSCLSDTDCFTVGSATDGTRLQTLVQRWNGSQWSMVGSPNEGAAAGWENRLASVSCAQASCTAVGAYVGVTSQVLVERWNGANWTLAAPANARVSRNNTLLGVACVAADDCWTVASYNDSEVQQTLIEHWDGTAWSVVPSPNTDAARGNILYDVTCTSTNDCWAAGYHQGDSAWQTLLLHWDGMAWDIVPSPSTSILQNNFLTDIACVSASDCWAVGYYDAADSFYETLTLHWNGSAWSLVDSPNIDSNRENRLHGVSCVATSECWAVGRYFDPGLDRFRTLTLRWNGDAWGVVESPNTGESQDNALHAVACIAADDCRAVGHWSAGSGTGQPLIEHWDGAAWRVVPAPRPTDMPGGYDYNFLRGVTCTSGADCWSVGWSFREGAFQPLVVRWENGNWIEVPSPSTAPDRNNYLVGVTCVSAAECWATGYHHDDYGLLRTMTQQFVALAPPVEEFAFAERTGVATGVYVTSNPAVVTGFAGALPIRIEGGQYRIDGSGVWTSGPGSIAAGSSLRVRHLSSSSASTESVSTVTVGDYGTSFRTVTSEADSTPDPFAFETIRRVAPGVLVESAALTPAGFNVAVPVQSGPGSEHRIGSGDWTSSVGTLLPGQSIQVRHVSSTTTLGQAKTWLKVGGVTGHFLTRTR